MGIGDGSVIGSSKILDNGSVEDRFNIVLVAEGYQNHELTQFETDAQDFVDHLVSFSPFDEMEAAFNVFRVNVSSTDSGADDPMACGGSGSTVATYFDASFCNGGIQRLTSVSTAIVIDVVNDFVPEWDQILVIINSSGWGGSGGTIATMTNSGNWLDACLHELGHAAFGLADEYEYWAGCGIDTDRDMYSGAEPAQPNVTTNSDRATIKWSTLIDGDTPMPTTSNADCSFCDPQPSPVTVGTVGAFEGGYYHHCGIYRPEYNCMMRNLGPFCAVCEQRIRETLQTYMPELPFHPELPERLYDFNIVPDWIFERWMLVAYLIINWKMSMAKEAKVKPDKRFFRVLARHMTAYLKDGVQPPKDIASTIMNLADDHLAGRQMTIRAGDYIALQNHIRRTTR